ncbi:MAG: DNA recombination protein RmuC, partial [Nitrospirae bacterium]|nr:DNA recombination protein RmuC [Nitrospirota bacterium]
KDSRNYRVSRGCAMMNEALYVAVGLCAGSAVVWIFAGMRFKNILVQREAELQREAADELGSLREKLISAETQIAGLKGQISDNEYETARLNSELQIQMSAKSDALARLDESQKSIAEQKKLIDEMGEKLSSTFDALSLKALSKNSEEFLKIAEERLKAQTQQNSSELQGKKELIDQNIEAISKTLADVHKKIEEVGKSSGEKITEVATVIKQHQDATLQLKNTTEHLANALASSKKRGEWGERMAEDIIRLIGMSEGINYIKQKTLESSTGRPDYTFLLPNDLKMNMDVKFPLDNYLNYVNAESDFDRKRFRDDLIRNTKAMIKQVTGRDYINPADNTVDYVIIFIPNEQIYAFINEVDPSIMDEALKQKVILCSPITLYAVLAVIRQAIENFSLERTALEILNLLGDFQKQWDLYKDKMRAMGDRLDAARKEYEGLIGTRTNQLERPLRKIEMLRADKSIEMVSEPVSEELPL